MNEVEIRMKVKSARKEMWCPLQTGQGNGILLFFLYYYIK